MIPASSLLQIHEKKMTIGFSKSHIAHFKAPYNYTSKESVYDFTPASVGFTPVLAGILVGADYQHA
jgi:hypothetical protein